MKISNKRILALAVLPIAVLFLSGCGKQPTPTTPQAMPAPVQQKKTPQSVSSTTPLPELPADNKQAIDSEIQGIDQAIQEADAALSTDVTDIELGL